MSEIKPYQYDLKLIFRFFSLSSSSSSLLSLLSSSSDGQIVACVESTREMMLCLFKDVSLCNATSRRRDTFLLSMSI
jgi:hypothetical protein